MNDAQTKLNIFKQVAIENCNNKNFTYKEWWIKDHLMIVERIAMELCNIHPEANRDLVLALVWFHDFGKPIDAENEYEITKTEGVKALKAAGFDDEFVDRVLEAWVIMEKKSEIDIVQQSIEVQIISTADGASHFVGKFHSSYFRDDSNESLESIEQRLKEKIEKDWERKIVLPEVKKSFYGRFARALEIIGEYPDKFIV